MQLIRRILFICMLCAGMLAGLLLYALYTVPKPTSVTYGASFNILYAQELGIDWKAAFEAMLRDLRIRHVRIAAHWPMVEPAQGSWNFSELDQELLLAHNYQASIILAVGRRLPRWPECHVPSWAAQLSWDEQKDALRIYLRTIIERYRDDPTITMWQVENEPFLGVFASDECGTLDTSFLDEEIRIVHELDPTRPILVTDSGNLGTWYGAYKRGDQFGTSMYLYVSNDVTGPMRSRLPPAWYIFKRRLMELVYGYKPSLLIELSVEPWMKTATYEAPVEEQLMYMNPERFDEIITYAQNTRFDTAYLWGVEWWYWLKTVADKPDMWNKARTLIHGGGPE